MAERKHVQHLRSKVVNDNQPKMPDASLLLFGELAVNYAKDYEAISFKNENDIVVSLHNDVEITNGVMPKKHLTEIWIDTSESATTEVYTKEQMDSQIGQLNTRVITVESGYTLQNEKIQTIETKVNTVSGKVDSNTNNIQVLKETKLDSSAYTPTDLSGYYTKSETNDLLAEKADHVSSSITRMGGYVSGTPYTNIVEGDSLNIAISKLESGLQDAIGGGVTSVSLSSGSTNGSLKLTVNGTPQNDAIVTGLKDAAYKSVGTTADDVASGVHTHDYNDITNLENSPIITNINNDITTISGAVNDNIVIGDSTVTKTNDTEIWIDTSESPSYVVYTQAQVDAMIANLQRQIDELRN